MPHRFRNIGEGACAIVSARTARSFSSASRNPGRLRRANGRVRHLAVSWGSIEKRRLPWLTGPDRA
mgnify:CR=1 FL=1